MKNYTLTVADVLANLGVLADAYEKVSAGTSPTGNYFFAVNAADAAASLKAAVYFIGSFGQQIPQWIPVAERLPPDGVLVFAYGKRAEYGFRRDGQWIDTLYGGVLANGPSHWMPLPAPPADAK